MASSPDGLNINKDCGSTSLEFLRETVAQEKADIGIAFDGDGDRVCLGRSSMGHYWMATTFSTF